MSGSSWCGCKKASTLLNLTCYKTCFNMLQEQHELQTNTSYSNTSKNPCIIMHHVHFSQLIRIHIAMPSDPPSNKVQVTQVDCFLTQSLAVSVQELTKPQPMETHQHISVFSRIGASWIRKKHHPGPVSLHALAKPSRFIPKAVQDEPHRSSGSRTHEQL